MSNDPIRLPAPPLRHLVAVSLALVLALAADALIDRALAPRSPRRHLRVVQGGKR